MPVLCTDCIQLIPFGWSEEPCDRCVPAATAGHDCDTLMAFGWDASICNTCRDEREPFALAA